ncbi:MAG: 4-hydroxy-tetrahydrodipicolinate synthase [Planctomycetota bacterium]|jgi:4-hydroxy-tetrahydrodipicolinate synthase|nr:4-hydroxy-tetrahydrodipicolinate synthase [Planctomycetota bacterium]RLS68618.1 MAG: 4-hydroxy-tetrahydrodipicolinate synthase [Planctomycetota bacterium]
MGSRKGSDFAGVGVAIVTPFREGKLDVKRLQEQIDFQISSGVTFLVPVGTTGESPTLSHDEHERVISEVIQAARGRCKVMAGTGSNCTAEALRLTRWAAKEGADASLQVAPYYNKPTQRGFYEHFKAIASEVGIPHCVYNIPGRSAKNIEPETIAKLAEIPNITMVKEATGSLDQCSQILNTTNLTVLSGDDSLTLPMMSIGAQGVISVAGNIVPGDLLAMVKAALEGDFVLAAKWHHKLFPLCRDMLSLATNPIPVKAAMMLLGRDTGELRLPMTSLEPKELDVLRGTLVRFGLMGQ